MIEEFRVGKGSPAASPRTGNDDLIETDDELLEVGSNEEEDDEEDEEEDNPSRPLDFTTGRKLSDSGMKSHQIIMILFSHFSNMVK